MRTTHPTRRRRSGFTLIEVLLVLVILVILGSIVTVGVRQAQKKALRDAAEAQIHGLKKGVRHYEFDIRSYPANLESLIQPPSDLKNPARWQGSYLDSKQLPLDPWDSPYKYELIDADTFRIWSAGPDGQDKTEDDISVTN